MQNREKYILLGVLIFFSLQISFLGLELIKASIIIIHYQL